MDYYEIMNYKSYSKSEAAGYDYLVIPAVSRVFKIGWKRQVMQNDKPQM